MFSETLHINADYLFLFIRLMGGLILFSIIYRVMIPIKVSDIKADELVINCFKLMGYVFLAGYIYLRVLANGNSEIDVLTFFTFLLAAFEATSNFNATLSILISTMIRMVFDLLFKKY